MVYPNKGLMNRDEREQEDLFSVFFKGNTDKKKRLHYVVGVGKIIKTGECVLIVDESDEVMFKNLKTFWNKINKEDRSVVCLTAAADDNWKGGVEEQALKTMGFKVYRNSRLVDLKTPQIHQLADVSDSNKLIEMIGQQRLKRGVLVYVDDTMMSEISVVEDYKVVSEDTPDEDLRAMDKKMYNQYPVFLIGKRYGNRGLDYRAINNRLGICLIIQTSCDSVREFIQLCKRVGRHNEDCHRIICTTIEQVDHKAFIQFTGNITAQLTQIEKDMEDECRSTPVKDPNNNDREMRQQQMEAGQEKEENGGMGLKEQEENNSKE